MIPINFTALFGITFMINKNILSPLTNFNIKLEITTDLRLMCT